MLLRLTRVQRCDGWVSPASPASVRPHIQPGAAEPACAHSCTQSTKRGSARAFGVPACESKVPRVLAFVPCHAPHVHRRYRMGLAHPSLCEITPSKEFIWIPFTQSAGGVMPASTISMRMH
jgi:hypothetical protein